MKQQDDYGDSRDIRASAEDTQRALMEFQRGVAQHTAAIQAAARALLAQHSDDDVGPREIKVEVAVGPGPDERAKYNSIDCWDEDVICGKSRSGYIHCTVHVCMEVGPITVEPG